jgi:hypothetical protein
MNHVTGYFRFYANVNFEDSILSVYHGKCIQRSTYKEYDGYKIDKPLCIAGPLGK